MVGMSIEQRVPDKQRYQPVELPSMKRAFPVWGVARSLFLWSFLLENEALPPPFPFKFALERSCKTFVFPFLVPSYGQRS